MISKRFPGGSVVKNPPASSGDAGSIPASGSSPGEGNGNPFQYSCLGNPVHRGAWQATVHGVTKKSDATLWSYIYIYIYIGFLGGASGRETPYNGEEVRNMDRRAWWAMVHRVAKNRTWLKQVSLHIYIHIYICIMYMCIYICFICILYI